MRITKQFIEKVVGEIVGPEAVDIVFYLRSHPHASEFKIAEDLKKEINEVRKLLYRLLEHNFVTFKRKKDKVKGWYISYWDLLEKEIPYIYLKHKKAMLEKLEQRLAKETENQFYICRNACVRLSFDEAFANDFKCVECGEIMHFHDNTKTIEFLKKRIKELTDEINKLQEMIKK